MDCVDVNDNFIVILFDIDVILFKSQSINLIVIQITLMSTLFYSNSVIN